MHAQVEPFLASGPVDDRGAEAWMACRDLSRGPSAVPGQEFERSFFDRYLKVTKGHEMRADAGHASEELVYAFEAHEEVAAAILCQTCAGVYRDLHPSEEPQWRSDTRERTRSRNNALPRVQVWEGKG